MRKIFIVGKDPEKIGNLKEKLAKHNFVYSDENPDLVISYGGDGTFLIAEREFPGVPKIMIRDSETCRMCCDYDIEEIIELYLKEEYKIQEISKLVARKENSNRELFGTNDIVIRNNLPTEAIRFKLKINGEVFEREFIGDGVVIATPYGSRGYFASITRTRFGEGIGIAFNNLTEHHDFLIVGKNDEIELEITRGPAVLVADNNRDFFNLEKGDKILVKDSGNIAKKILLT